MTPSAPAPPSRANPSRTQPDLMLAPPDSNAVPYLEAGSAFCELDGMRIHYTRDGSKTSGTTIVLLHGSGASLHIFNPVAAQLARKFDVVRLDLPGFGLTGPRPDRDYTIETYVQLLDRFLDQHAAGRVLLAGHSLGGRIAWTYALEHADRLSGLVLMNATGYPEKSVPLALRLPRNPFLRPILRRFGSRRATAQNLRGVVGPGSSAVDDAMIDRVHALMSRPGNRSAFVDFANTDQRDRSAEIRTITTPTLVLRSDLIDGQHFARDIADSREVVLAGVGHLMPAEEPAAVADAITMFATSIGDGGR
jgi:pimeloyl-ACP methyl ester carboxylesterase